MGSNIAKICSIKKVATAGNEKTTAGSLAAIGAVRQPGSFIRVVPYREANGKYRTNLDENASYISKLPEALRADEKDLVKKRREELEDATMLELGPRSKYFSGIYGEDYGNISVASSYKLKDGENVFDLDDPFSAITFWWVSAHPLVAPSYEDYKSGKAGPEVQYYVSNPEVENKVIFNENKAINRAIVDMDTMTPEKRKTVAKLLGLPISDNDVESVVYNQLDKFIKSGDVKTGEHKGFRAIALFNTVVGLKDDVMAVKAVIRDALAHNIYRKINSIIYEGENMIAESEDLLLKKFTSNKGQQEFIMLEKKISEKKLIAR